MIRQGWLSVVMIGVVMLGCEKASPPPQITEKPPTDVAPTVVPTTQELMGGKYKKVSLMPLPLSAEVPDSWKVETLPGTSLTCLRGYGLDGRMIQMSLEIGTPLATDNLGTADKKLKNVLDGATRASTRESQSVRKFDVRSVGDIKRLEEQRIFAGSTQPSEQLLDWKVTFFVSRNDEFAPYSVRSLGLTTDQYEQSKDLLHKIYDSITPDAVATK
jgi:hypothetical protein